jgi:hypothetical protein
MSARTRSTDVAAEPWAGPQRRYDIVKEFVIALVVMAVLSAGLAVAFSSPDEKALTFKGWGTTAADNFYAVTVGELAGTTESAAYGPPYQAGDGLAVGPLRPQKWMGVRIPVDAANDFVIAPLQSSAQTSEVTAALAAWQGATPDQRTTWATALDDAVQATADADGALHPEQVASGDYGPVPVLAKGLTEMAASGSLDGAMLSQGTFYGSADYTKAILFMGDGSYLDDAATAQNLQGNTWGMMNGTNSYPGQPWLWWASFWYQIPTFNPAEDATTTTSLQDNADAWIFYIIGVIGLVIILFPFVPGLRSIPRWIPVHRLIWRTYYREHGNDHLV